MERSRVFIVGAGLSAALGFPLTHDLLVRLWKRIDTKVDFRERLEKVIKFHHPGFDPARFTSFPNIEQLLSEMLVNEELWDASRRGDGNFQKRDLVDIRFELLAEIANWFNEISNRTFNDGLPPWLETFKRKVSEEPATAIISFNWDLVLDELLFGDSLNKVSYGMARNLDRPVLLKPHGSLNWYEDEFGRFLSGDKRFELFGRGENKVHVFNQFRSPISKAGRKYNPLIVPPAFLKNFGKPIFEELWNKCIEIMGTATEVIFVGYSLPEADLHARFIFSCCFHDQEDGLLSADGLRRAPTGSVPITIVNPDKGAAQRIEALTGNRVNWEPMTAAEWIQDRM